MFNNEALAFLLYAAFLPETGLEVPTLDGGISNPAASVKAADKLVEFSIKDATDGLKRAQSQNIQEGCQAHSRQSAVLTEERRQVHLTPSAAWYRGNGPI